MRCKSIVFRLQKHRYCSVKAMLLGGKSYDIAMRKLSYCKIIALPLSFCSIFPTPFIQLYIKKTDKDLLQ